MKVKIKATGEIGTVANLAVLFGNKGYRYQGDEVEIIDSHVEVDTDADNDYWTKLEQQYAGMAMQGILHQWGDTYISCPKSKEQHLVIVVNAATEIAHALVEKMKEERKWMCM